MKAKLNSTSNQPVERMAAGGRLSQWQAHWAAATAQARITYTGGYVMPGTTPAPAKPRSPTTWNKLPSSKSHTGSQHREKLGLLRIWPHQGTYEQFSGFDLLPSVQATLKSYQRWSI